MCRVRYSNSTMSCDTHEVLFSLQCLVFSMISKLNVTLLSFKVVVHRGGVLGKGIDPSPSSSVFSTRGIQVIHVPTPSVDGTRSLVG